MRYYCSANLILTLTALSVTLALTPEVRALDQAAAPAATVLRLKARTELPGYSGDFDHFGVDLAGNRLFLAAEDHGTLEVFNLKTGAHLQTLTGVKTPHSIHFMPVANRLLVTDSGPGMSKLMDATTYKTVATVRLVPGADSIGYDAPRNHLYVVTGGKDVHMRTSVLADIDPLTGKSYGGVQFDSDHVEAMAVEQHGNHIYINVTDKNYLAVVDKTKHKIVARWPIREGEQNAPLAFDEMGRRLFVVTRKPGKLIVMNADTGASLTSFPAPARADEVVYDQRNRRIYVTGGEGYIGVYEQVDADHYRTLAPVSSAVGAKTAVLVPDLATLYVAASPGEAKLGGAILRFDVAPRDAKP